MFAVMVIHGCPEAAAVVISAFSMTRNPAEEREMVSPFTAQAEKVILLIKSEEITSLVSNVLVLKILNLYLMHKRECLHYFQFSFNAAAPRE